MIARQGVHQLIQRDAITSGRGPDVSEHPLHRGAVAVGVRRVEMPGRGGATVERYEVGLRRDIKIEVVLLLDNVGYGVLLGVGRGVEVLAGNRVDRSVDADAATEDLVAITVGVDLVQVARLGSRAAARVGVDRDYRAAAADVCIGRRCHSRTTASSTDDNPDRNDREAMDVHPTPVSKARTVLTVENAASRRAVPMDRRPRGRGASRHKYA
jgi:hypothetical protein